MQSELDLAECVKRGAELLDRTHAGWAELIDLSKLDLNDCLHCILGQMFGSFNDVVDYPERTFPGVFDLEIGLDAFGFTTCRGHGEPREVAIGRFRGLTRLWREQIERRLACPTN
jgi:hypothetical protein